MRAPLLVLVACFALSAQDALSILETNCAGCHGAAAMGGLDLRSRDGALKGGTRGAAVVPGKSATSLLLQAVRKTGELKMPPGTKSLSAAEIATLAQWIDAGARWSGELKAAPSWWSLQPVRKPASGNSIDDFLNAQLRAKGLQAAPAADRRTLIRRATFDLHGLPPSPGEIEAFEKDGDFAQVIDRLLASPRYGERWGRHWLDVVRYADTGGFETDIYFPNAWRYRDYVIKSFNDDKPYDRFVQEQVAGDELWSDDLDLDGGFEIPAAKLRHLEARIGTGLYTIGPAYHEAALFGGQVRYEWLTDVVDTTGEAFLGLTLGCARCHNHKFDPLTQRDYHAMMAVFATSEEREIPAVSPFSIFGFKSGYPTWLRVEELKAAIGRIDQAARKRVVDRVRARFSAGILAAYDVPSPQRTPAQRALAAQLEGALTAAGLQENAEGKTADIPYTAADEAEKKRLIVELGEAALKANPVAQTATVLGKTARAHDVHMTHRGDWRSRGDKVEPAFPQALAGGTQVDHENRRTSLARWLTHPAHPLTARVIVNRVWHWHFGRGIVGTPNDFGRQGEAPTHPALLDWLASEFVQNGWSLKKLHRTIMLSAAYQRSSAHNEANARIDAGNLNLWRMNRQRIDAETLRDSMLAASGALNLKMGGRPVIPPLGKEEYTVMWARNQWPEALDPREHTRRSVYLYVKRTFPLPMLSAFDAPDTSMSCSRRDSTTVAPQALTLINGEFSVAQANRFAGRVRTAADPIAEIWRTAFGRPPSAAEKATAAKMPLEQLCLVVFNTNEFLYVD
jgi:cytochrome c553